MTDEEKRWPTDYDELTSPADDDAVLVFDDDETTVGKKIKWWTLSGIKTWIKTWMDTLVETGGPTVLTMGAVADGEVLTRDGTTIVGSAGGGGGAGASTPPGRLTLESGVPVSTTDQADKTMLYYALMTGNLVQVYNGSAWVTLTIASEPSLNMAAFTASKPYDIWGYDNSGIFALDSTVWTNATTRATALAYQDGRLVKSGDATRLYIGTIFIDAGQKCQLTFGETPAVGGSSPKMFVYNEYNQVDASFYSKESTDSWAYTTAAYRGKNNDSAKGNAFQFINGNKLLVDAFGFGLGASSDAARSCLTGFGVDTVSTRSGLHASIESPALYVASSNDVVTVKAIGYHYIQEIEMGQGNQSYYGDRGSTSFQSGALYKTKI